MGPVPKEERSDPSRDNNDGSLMEPGFAVMENDATDSDDENSGDETELANQGYQLLSQDPDQICSEDCLPEQASSSTDLPNSNQSDLSAQLAHVLPKETPKPDISTIVTHTDSPESLKNRRERMANDDLIKAAMSGISLPSSGVPNWAKFVQEKDWKTDLFKTIKKKDTKEENDSDKSS